MPAAIIAILLKDGIPLLLEILQRLGFFDEAESIALKTGLKVVQVIDGIKTYAKPSDFPNPPPGESSNDASSNDG